MSKFCYLKHLYLGLNEFLNFTNNTTFGLSPLYTMMRDQGF
jgi:hypothetical protein